MEIKKGIGVSPGVVICTAVVLDAEDLLIPKRTIPDDQLEHEVDRLNQSLRESEFDLQKLREQVTDSHGKEIGGIFDFHLGILHDKSLIKQIIAEIKLQKTTAEYAV